MPVHGMHTARIKTEQTPCTQSVLQNPKSTDLRHGVVFFSPCFWGPVGEVAELFLAWALSPGLPVAAVFLGAWFLPPWESLVF